MFVCWFITTTNFQIYTNPEDNLEIGGASTFLSTSLPVLSLLMFHYLVVSVVLLQVFIFQQCLHVLFHFPCYICCCRDKMFPQKTSKIHVCVSEIKNDGRRWRWTHDLQGLFWMISCITVELHYSVKSRICHKPSKGNILTLLNRKITQACGSCTKGRILFLVCFGLFLCRWVPPHTSTFPFYFLIDFKCLTLQNPLFFWPGAVIWPWVSTTFLILKVNRQMRPLKTCCGKSSVFMFWCWTRLMTVP